MKNLNGTQIESYEVGDTSWMDDVAAETLGLVSLQEEEFFEDANIEEICQTLERYDFDGLTVMQSSIVFSSLFNG